MTIITFLLWLLLIGGVHSTLDCYHSNNIECSCTNKSIFCSGRQEEHAEIQQLLSNLSATDLQYLVFNITDLAFLPDTTFETLKLENITLGVDLKLVHDGLFSGLEATLVHLNLQYNDLEFTNNQPFSSLYSLKELNLDFNKLVEIDAYLFLNLSKLEFLSIVGNDLSNLQSNFLENLPELQTLVLDKNNFSSLSDIKITSPTLINLSLQACLIEGSLKKEHLEGLHNLEVVDLSSNKLVVIESKALSQQHFLQVLNLSSNDLEELQNHAFSALYNLRSLDLKNNKISFIAEDVFLNLTNLKFLDLSGNKVAAFLSKYTSELYSLERIYLQNNRIKIITAGTFSTSTNLQEIFLGGNVLDCSCEISYLSSFLINNSHINVEGDNAIICASPPSVRGTELLKLDIASMNCDLQDPELDFIDDSDYISNETSSISTNQVEVTTEMTSTVGSSETHSMLTTGYSGGVFSSSDISTELSSTADTTEPPVMMTISYDDSIILTSDITTTFSTELTSTPSYSEPPVVSTTNDDDSIFSSFPDFNITLSTKLTSTLSYSEPPVVSTTNYDIFSMSPDINTFSTDSTSIANNSESPIVITNFDDSILSTSNITTTVFTELTSTSNDSESLVILTTENEDSVFPTSPSITTFPTTNSVELITQLTTMAQTDKHVYDTTANSFSPVGHTTEQSSTHTQATEYNSDFSNSSSVDVSEPYSSANVTSEALFTTTDLTTTTQYSPLTDITSFNTNAAVQSSIDRIVVSKPDQQFSVIHILDHTILDGELCVRWSISGAKLIHPTCSIQINSQIGKGFKNFKCPTYGNEIRQCVDIDTIYEFCINIYVFNMRRNRTCTKIETLTTGMTEATEKTVDTTQAVMVTSTLLTQVYTDTTHNTLPTTNKSIDAIPIPFKVTSLYVKFYYGNSSATVHWSVNVNERNSICKLILFLSSYNANRTEGTFSCSNNSYNIQNIKDHEAFKICVVSHHYEYGIDKVCDPDFGFSYELKASKHKDSGFKNSSLITVICLLVVVMIIIVIIVLKKLLKKTTDSDRYNVAGEEERVQKRVSSSQRRDPCVRYSYTLKETV